MKKKRLMFSKIPFALVKQVIIKMSTTAIKIVHMYIKDPCSILDGDKS